MTAPTGPVFNFLTSHLSSALSAISGKPSTVHGDLKKAVVLLTAFYVLAVFILSSLMSIMAQVMGNEEGYKNKEPRFNKKYLPPGLPARMCATHDALFDIFPAYAVTASLVASSVGNYSQPIVPLNALVLHVFLKVFVYTPSYVLDLDIARTYSHMFSVAALLVGLWHVVAN